MYSLMFSTILHEKRYQFLLYTPKLEIATIFQYQQQKGYIYNTGIS
jgi:hypothetical protein